MEMKVLIVDDEEPQRRGLKRHVAWSEHLMRVSAEAESTEQALRIAAADPPDLMITDIRMLGADGLELSASMRKLNPKLHVVVITGYEQFEYAKTAVDLGVDAFLVKPVDFRELGAVLEGISRSFFGAMHRERQEAELREQLTVLVPLARESFIRDLLGGIGGDEESVRERARYLGVFADEATYLVAVAAVGTEKALSAEEAELERLRLRACAEAELGECIEAASTTARGDLVLILRGRGEAVGEGLVPVLDRFRESVEATHGGRLSVGVGPAVDALLGIADSYRLAQLAVNQRVLSECGQTIRWKDIAARTPAAGTAVEMLGHEVLSSLRRGDVGAVRRGIEGIVRALLEAGSVSVTETRSVCLELASKAFRSAAELGVPGGSFKSERELWRRILDADGIPEIARVTREMLEEVCELFRDNTSSRHRLIVRRAVAAIHERFGEDLTLADVAGTVYLSPSYLGAVLRAEMGQSFTEILTGIRIERAKELLSDLRLKLYEISDRIGYQNPAYFSAVFKRHTGLSPKEFRDSMGEPGIAGESHK